MIECSSCFTINGYYYILTTATEIRTILLIYTNPVYHFTTEQQQPSHITAKSEPFRSPFS